MAWQEDLAHHPPRVPRVPRATPPPRDNIGGDIDHPRDPGTRPGVPVLEPCRLALATLAGYGTFHPPAFISFV